jgi:capsular polysaccharide biosynthesis protein
MALWCMILRAGKKWSLLAGATAGFPPSRHDSPQIALWRLEAFRNLGHCPCAGEITAVILACRNERIRLHAARLFFELEDYGHAYLLITAILGENASLKASLDFAVKMVHRLKSPKKRKTLLSLLSQWFAAHPGLKKQELRTLAEKVEDYLRIIGESAGQNLAREAETLPQPFPVHQQPFFAPDRRPELTLENIAPDHPAILRLTRPSPEQRTPAVLRLRDVILDGAGNIFTPDGRILQCHGTRLDRAQQSLRILRDQKNVETMPRHARAASPINHASTYYHWMCESLPSLSWMTAPETPAIPILLPSATPSFKRESLDLAGLGPRVVSFDEPLHRCDELLLGTPLYDGIGTGGLLPEIYERMLAGAGRRQPSARPKPLLYVSRRDSGRRRLRNESLLEQELAQLGFHSVVLSSLSLVEQIILFRDARLIVAPHGAGLSNLVFSRPGTFLLELIPCSDHPDQNHRSQFVELARLKGLAHSLHLCPYATSRLEWDVDTRRVAGIVGEQLRRTPL